MSEKQEHTPEPWRLSPLEKYEPVCIVTEKKSIALLRMGLTFDWNSDTTREEDIANARRIVACVNACARFSTEDIEAMVKTRDILEGK